MYKEYMDRIVREDLEKYLNFYVAYSIRFIRTNQYYVGYTENIISRVYNSFHGHIGSLNNPENIDYIHLVMRKYGLNEFEFCIESLHNTKDEALSEESKLVIKYDSFNNGFNMTNNGFGGTGGRIRVFQPDTQEEMFIKPSELDKYKSMGYKKGSNRVLVSYPNDYKEPHGLFKRVKLSELRYYLDQGFTIGSLGTLSTTKGNIFVYNELGVRSIKADELNYYLELGYKKGFPHNSGRIKYYNKYTGEETTFRANDLIPDGYMKGRTKSRGLYKMTNGINTVRIPENDINEYLNNGYLFTN